MILGERRRLVFHNIAVGHSVPAVMAALQMSEKEVEDDLAFVVRKLRSYRFERGMPLIPLGGIAEIRANRVDALYTLSRLNAGKDPAFSRIETLPFLADNGGKMSDAELKLLELRMRAGEAAMHA